MNRKGALLAFIAFIYTIMASIAILTAALYFFPIYFTMPARAAAAIAVRMLIPSAAIFCAWKAYAGITHLKHLQSRRSVGVLWVISVLPALVIPMTAVPLLTVPYIPAALMLTIGACRAKNAEEEEALLSN